MRPALSACVRHIDGVGAMFTRILSRIGAGPRSRTDVLNHLVHTRGYRRYLEIGVRDRRHNFDKVVAVEKHGVDPAPRRPVSHVMTSDAFFAALDTRGGAPSYDLVFIDGLHLAEQVERDVANALRYLAPNGAVVLHDCNPQSEDAQTTEYDGKKQWNGTVWKAWAKLRATRSDLHMFVVDIDHGCGVIQRGHQTTIDLPVLDFAAMTWTLLVQHRARIMNLVTPREFVQLVEKFNAQR